MNDITIHSFRLKPGEDLQQCIQQLADEQQIQAGWIGTCVGSLTKYNIRFANASTADSGNGYFKIVSLTGTVSCNGSHLHIALADAAGKTIGGHLCEGCIVYTTAEIVILSTSKFIFKREVDGSTPSMELQIKPNS